MFAGDQTLLFYRFWKCLREPTSADLDIIVYGITLEKATLDVPIKTLIEVIVEEDAEDNLTDYTQKTTKPRALKCRLWIRRIGHINIYLNQVSGPTKIINR